MRQSEWWLALRPKRTVIEAAFHVLGMPLTGWMNEVPQFKAGFRPDWDEIESIALNVESVSSVKPKATSPVPKPKPREKTRKPVKKTR